MANDIIQQSEELFNSAETLNNIYTKYPRLKKFVQIDDIIFSPEKYKEGEGQLEFHHADEDLSPFKGRTVIEIYNPNLKGEWLEQAIFGDMLHGLPNKDPEFTELRSQFKDSLEDWQMQRAHEKHQEQEAGKKSPHMNIEYPPRDFDKAFDVSILDGFIRGYIAPDERDEWRNFYTDEQKGILDNMVNLLQEEE